MKVFVKALLIFLLLGIIFYDNAFTAASLGFADRLRGAFASPVLLVRNFFRSSFFVEQMAELQRENQSLQAQLLRQTLGRDSNDYLLAAKVHAIFPFSNKGAFTVDVGLSEGVSEGMIVVLKKDVFVGQISKVGFGGSEVRTIFDIGWQIPVRVGSENTPALLLAGTPPLVSMIDKARVPTTGDAIFTAGRGIPYGLKVGNLKNIRETSGGTFKDGDLVLPYVSGELEQVFVILR